MSGNSLTLSLTTDQVQTLNLKIVIANWAQILNEFDYSGRDQFHIRCSFVWSSPVRSDDGDGAAPLRRPQRAVVVVVCSVRIIHDPSEK